MKRRTVAMKFGVGATLAVLAAASHAAGLTDLTAAISFTDVLSAIISVGVLVIGVDLATLGYMKVRRLVKGAH